MDTTFKKTQLTSEEIQFREKYLKYLINSGILSKDFDVACTRCDMLMKRAEITPKHLNSVFDVLMCERCVDVTVDIHNGNVKCCWCAKNENLIACVKNDCPRKFCKNCIIRIRRTSEVPNHFGSMWVCVFCDFRHLWKDRAISSVIFPTTVKQEDVEMPLRAIENVYSGNASSGGTKGSRTRKDEQDRQCVICMNSKSEIAFFPCGHMCICTKCCREYEVNRNTCPVCRKQYKTSFKIYFS